MITETTASGHNFTSQHFNISGSSRYSTMQLCVTAGNGYVNISC